MGKFTSYQYNGNSVIDYCLISEEAMTKVLYFHVDDPILRLSDHSKISVRMTANFLPNKRKTCPMTFPKQFKWESISPQLFAQSLREDVISSRLEDILASQINDESDINMIVSNFSNVIISAANKSLKKRKISKGKLKKNKKWFDIDLVKMKKTLDYKGKLYAKYPNDPLVRGSFYKFRKNYNKLCKFKRKRYKADLIDKLDNLFENDPKAYWSLLDELRENTRDSCELLTSPEDMHDHFSNLNVLQNKFQHRAKELEEQLNQAENMPSFCKLDFCITKEEISKCLHSLKNGKSSGLDCISNEMLKYGETSLLPCMLKIFNSILQLGIYPSEWKKGYLNPIYKAGPRSDPSNYRGISIMSCLGKLFNCILNNRLNECLSETNVIDESQIGFQKKARTSDHMLVLRTLTEKYTKQNNSKLFTCFIDFRKAFDSVLHQALFLKLQKCGISGLFYNIIKNMYANNVLMVKIGQVLTDEFRSELGVRQGDTLSPNLFKIFINDLVDIFDSNCDAVTVGDFPLNCLMYADDLILISESEKGLQNCLNKLEHYCKDWCLDINIDKTKSLVFNKSGRLLPYSFHINGKMIENVKTYKYLGIIFSASGIFSHARKDLYNRGLKAFFKLKSIFGELTPNVDTSLHIFDHTIKPILLYGCEIWGSIVPPKASVRNVSEFKLEKAYSNFESEKLSMKFYKYILGVHKKATNLAVTGDLGRTPYFIDIVCSILKYFKRIEAMDAHSLLYQTLETCKKLHKNGKHTWYSGIEFIVNELDINLNMSLEQIKRKLIQRSMRYWENQVIENAVIKRGKLRTYYTFKPIFKKEIYLRSIINRDVRKCFTQFRISAHQLAIEKGRHRNIKAHNRLCKFCQTNEVEDEFHFLIKCQKFSSERNKLFSDIHMSCVNFLQLSEENKFLWLMTTEDTLVLHKLANHIYTCFNIRNQPCSSSQ